MSEFQPSQFPASQADQRSGFERRGDFRSESWHLDKKVPLSLIFAMLVQFGMALMAYADIKKDVELLKADQVVLHQRDMQQSDNLRDALKVMQDQFQRLDAKLDRLIERGQK